MSHFNRATEAAVQRSEKCECAICYDTSGSDLVTVILPGCGHRFHEFCIQKWLSPISLPPTTPEPVRFWSGDLDSDFHQIQERATVFESMERLGLFAGSSGQFARLSSGDEIDSDVEQALEAAYARADDDDDMEQEQEANDPEAGSGHLMPREPADFSTVEEDELEEGEIRGVPPPHQNPHNIQNDARGYVDDDDDDDDDNRYTPRESSNCCPYCRTPAFFLELIECHADTLQFIRVRLRLTDLAYRCLGFTPTQQELEDRLAAMDFLARRHADNLAIGEREIPLTPSNCRSMFRRARIVLLEKAFVYSVQHQLQGDEFHTLARFGLLFKHLKLQNHQIPYFFDPNPAYGDCLVGFEMTADAKKGLTHDPEGFFQELRLGLGIVPHSYVPQGGDLDVDMRAPPSSSVDPARLFEYPGANEDTVMG
ncbi:MAG: hypothetical protein Q9186_000195 [Xanthomendoza sp. 1 TL-2023]